MTRPALRAAGALLCVATLPALAPSAQAVPAPAATAQAKRAAAPPALIAASTAIKEITARQATMPYLQWLDTLPRFRFSPATSRLLVRQFGTDRLFSVTRTVLPTGARNYVMTVPTLRRANPDGSSFAWSAMQGQMAVQPDGRTVIHTFSAPRIVAENNALRVEARALAYSSATRDDNGLSFGEGIAELGNVEISSKPEGAGLRMDGLFAKFNVIDQGASLDLVNDMGIRNVAVQGERIDDLHLALRVSGLDKTAMETLGKLGKQLPATPDQAATRAQYTALAAPLLRQLGLAVIARGAAIDLDDLSFSYRGNKASMHGQVHLENATPDDLAQPASLLKKVAAHFDVQLPLAMLHAFADNMARNQLAKQQPGADAATIATLATTLYDGLLRSATASGYVRVDGDLLVTTIDIHDGVILLNGKPVELPKAPAPSAAVAGPTGLMRARRIAEKCTLPDFPPDVVANDRALALTMRLTVNADGTVSRLMLARSSGLPEYDQAVLAAAAQCTYIPALLAGKPVAVPSTWEVVRAPGSVRP